MISLKDVQLRRAGRLVLDVADLTVGKGESVAVIGPNGAGKSTLLQVMACLLPLDSGSLTILGERIERGANPIHVRRRTAMVLQRACLLNASVFDNVALGLRIRKAPESAIRERVVNALSMFGVEHLARRPARALSGGESQRVSLARAFALEPEILFLDEPFNALDLATRTALLREVGEAVRASGAATVFVTHDVTEIPFLGDRTIVMNEGRVVADGSIRRVLEDDMRDALSELLYSASWLCGKDGDDGSDAYAGFPIVDSKR
ncbi:MAG: energy-coupling factor ABC transporter ATP-binding protein [Bacillota bacterium]|jgi:tungstate transport system ATP-binding protein